MRDERDEEGAALPDYTVIETIGEGKRFALSRARGDQDQHPVLIKAPFSESPPPEVLQQLEHEYAIANDLDSASVVRPLELERYPGRATLVLEDFGGQPLALLLGAPMELGQALRIAIRVAAALAEIHERNVVHKDINPQNILVNPQTGEVKITGFGIASLLPREHPVVQHPDLIEGTLPYMSPEQTGRMNRALDYRTDLYSLGVTLYQMLTGELPCQARDPLEWVHCHIARTPRPPVAVVPEIPQTVSGIVMRLLAKVAEERYQTALGLKADLERCLVQWEATGRVEPFPLGGRDIPDRFQIPQKLYGRDREVAALLQAYDRVAARGTPELVLVSGYSGIGKSSLVHELHRPIVRDRGFFISGKFDQYKRDIPYSTIAQAFRELIQQLLTESEARVAAWRGELLEALGGNGQLVVDVIPEVELIIGEQPPVMELPLTEAQNRFNTVFRRFLGVFTKREHPLVLFLDDLQWLDFASLKLIQHIITHPDTRYLLLIGAYRDNEVSPSHPLMLTLDEIHKTEAIVRKIVLGPLAFEHLNQLVADTFRCNLQRAEPLARLVHEKASGNPFFTIQFLTTLYQEDLVGFDHRKGAFKWDLGRIRDQGYTDNVVDFMVGRLARLPEATQKAVQLAACIGNKGLIRTLATILGESEEETLQDLWEAIRRELILHVDGTYRFLHDRVQQAAYALIPEDRRSEMHLRIGRVLLAHTPEEEIEEGVFDLVNQFNLGVSLISARDEKARVADLNLLAGRRAKASTAYQSAISFLSTGMALLRTDCWETQYELAYALHFERAECEYLSGNHNEGVRRFSELLRYARARLEKADVYRLLVDVCTSKDALDEAIEYGIEGLRLFGIEEPPRPTWAQVLVAYEEVWKNLGDRQIEDLINLPLMTDPEMEAALAILVALGASTLVTNMNLSLLCHCHMVNISLRHGHSPAAAMAYVCFGMDLGPAFGRYPEGYRFGKLAYDLMEKHGFLAYRAKISFILDNILYWTQHLRNCLDHLDVAFRTAVEVGDLTFAGYCCNHLVIDRLVLGDPLEEVYRESEKRLDFTRKANLDAPSQAIIGIQRVILNLRGLTANFSTFSDAQFDQVEYEALMDRYGWPIVICWSHIMKLMARFLSGDYEEAIAAARKAKALLFSTFAHLQEIEYWYYYPLALAAHYHAAPPEQQREYLEIMATHQEKLREWAANGPENFLNRYALVSAEIARIRGNDPEAMRLYEQAIRSARENGYIQNEGIGYELAARFYLERGFETFARVYLQEARHCYARWGADGKVKQLDRQYPSLLERKPPSLAATIAAPPDQLDLMTVLKASQAIAREIVLSDLLKTLMRIVIENAGAQRGYLILAHDGDLRIEAEAGANREDVNVFQVTPVAASPLLSQSIVNYVVRARETVILDDAASPNIFSSDDYLVRNRPKSVLCFPILRQDRVLGILYLENNLITGAFTPDRLTVLELLASQTAISLQNAMLYSDLQQEEEALRFANEALREADRRKDEFLAMLSHELRNPLAAIASAMHVLRLRGGGNGMAERARDAADRQLWHMKRLVDDLLDVARVTRGQVVLRKEEVDLAGVVETALQTARPAIEAKGHVLDYDAAKDSMVVEGDPARLAQVVANLLDNAAKYTPAGGHIWLSVERVGADAVVRVRDDGMGIAADLLPHIFDLFVQGERSLARTEGGLGIGLTLVRRLVEMHGGSITAHSDGPGKGSEFVVRIPAQGESKAQRAGEPTSRGEPGAVSPAKAKRILLVEDNADTAELTAMALESDGYEVTIAHDGPAALEVAGGYRPDVALLDLGLPGMDGYEVARRLRKLPGLADTPLVAVTGYGQEEDVERSRAAGFAEHLVKPVDVETLLRVLASSAQSA